MFEAQPLLQFMRYLDPKNALPKLEEGDVQARKEIARTMKDQGFTAGQINKITGFAA